MRWRRWGSGSGLLIGLAALNLALGVGLFALRPPGRAIVITTPVTLPAPVQTLVGRMDGRHRGEPYTLTLTDAELTEAIAYFLATSPEVPFTDVRVVSRDGRIIVNGTARGAAVGVPVQATMTVIARGGRPIVTVEDVRLGSTPLPTFVRQQIIAQANASVDLSQYDLGITVESITVDTGTLTVRGKLT